MNASLSLLARGRPLALFAAALLVLLPLAACGGSGGGTPNPPPPPGTDDPPTLNVLAPTGPVAEIPGGSVRVAFTANDDGAATVRIFVDADGDPATTGDQTGLFTGGTQNGALQVRFPTLPSALPPGSTTLFVEVDDGVNAPVVSAGSQILLYAGIAGVAPPRSNTYGVATGWVVFSVGEAENGNVVLNADGLADDAVMAFLDAANGTFVQSTFSANASTAGPGGVPRVLKALQSSVAWNLLESDQGQDFNNDGDLLDTYVVVADPSTNPIPVLLPTGGMNLVPTVSALRFFAIASEASASADINFDGDQIDNLFFAVNPNGTLLPYVTDTPAAGTPFVSAPGIDRAAYRVDEALQGFNNTGIDLRGDGDTTDILLAIVDHAGGRLALAGQDPTQMPPQLPRNIDPTAAFAVSDSSFAGYYVDEAATQAGGGGPLNLDADTTDFIPAVYAPSTMVETMPGTGLNAGAGARFFFFDGAVALYTASEEGLVDRNGDGDTLDTEVLYWTDATTAPTVATLLAPGVPGLAGLALDGGTAARVANGWIGVVATETANADLNGDGDTLDAVYLLVDIRRSPPVVWNTGLVPLPTGAIGGSTIPRTGVGGDDGVVIQVAETANGGDLNGDGDNADTLLFFFDFGAPATAVALPDTGGFHAANVSGRIAVTASEALTGEDFDGDGTALGFALRVFDTAGQVLEPGRTSSPVSVPASQAGSIWVYLRSEPAENADLNQDGDQADVILALWLD